MSTITYAGVTDVGQVRSENQDRWFADPDQGLYLVADGMGGMFDGGLAAEAVAEILPRLLEQRLRGIEQLDDPKATDRVLSAMSEMSDRLRSESKEQLGITGMGSTVARRIDHGETQHRARQPSEGHALTPHLAGDQALDG